MTFSVLKRQEGDDRVGFRFRGGGGGGGPELLQQQHDHPVEAKKDGGQKRSAPGGRKPLV